MLNCTWHLGKANMKPPKAWPLPNMLRWTYLYSFWSWNKLIVGLQMTFLIAFSPIRVCTFWLEFPSGVINNKLALVQIMAWRQTGDKTLSGAMTVYCCTYPSLSLDEVTQLKKARKFADEILQKYFFLYFDSNFFEYRQRIRQETFLSLFKTFQPEQNGCHFEGDLFKGIF